jgi:opacity protein-like surface antigen
MRNRCLLLLFALFFAAVCFAQEPTPGGRVPTSTAGTNPNEVFLGFMWEPTDWGTAHLDGFDANYTRFVGKRFAAVADFDYGKAPNTINAESYAYRFGPRYNFLARTARVQPYVHLLVGDGHLTATVRYNGVLTDKTWNGFTWAAGGGVDVKISKHWGARFQGDWTKVPYGDHDSSQWQRLAFGATWKW